MTSRLDRLFVLLDSGSSDGTRRAAAQQLGEVQRLHPHELHHLLARIATYLRSTSWETRIAAGQAVDAVIRSVPPWDPPGCPIKKESSSATLPSQSCKSFSTFDVNKVLDNGAHLMGSEGKEYEQEEEKQGVDPQEKVTQQRRLLSAQLGLSHIGDTGIEDMIVPEDLTTHREPSNNSPGGEDRSVAESVQHAVSLGSATGMSTRERNRARRLARIVAKQKSRDAAEDQMDDSPEVKRCKIEPAAEEAPATPLPDSIPDSTGSWGEAIEWPFEAFCEQLCQDLLSPCWEVRHGAATAVREVVRVHGAGAGKCADMSMEEMEEANKAWLEDTALRILCVLALDRFGDFVSDQVVAPVRETCAQALGMVLRLLSREGVYCVLRILLQLLERPEWEARHGGLLGLKYTLAVRPDLDLLPTALPAVLRGLDDPVEDVGAVAAAALIPMASELAVRLPQQLAPTINRLWDLLKEQDELAAASNSFMALLAALLSQPASRQLHSSESLNELLPRLWPFLEHATSSVRRSTLQTLATLAATPLSLGTPENGQPPMLQETLRHVFQRALLETEPDIQLLVEKVWGSLVRSCPLEEVLVAACPYVSSWLCLTMQPSKLPFDPTLLIKSQSKTHKQKQHTVDSETSITEQKYYIGGSEAMHSEIRERSVVQARCMACRMLGLLSCYLVKQLPGIEPSPTLIHPLDHYVKVITVYLQSKSALQRMVVGFVIAEWARLDPESPCHEELTARLHHCLSEHVYFDEIALSFTKLLQETKDFVAMLRHYRVPVEQPSVLTLEQIQALSGPTCQKLLAKSKLNPKALDSLEERRKVIHSAVLQTSCDQSVLSLSTQAALSGSVTMLGKLPEKLNPVVKPLMESIKREQRELLQRLAAQHLTRLMDICHERTPSPNPKIINNLCTFLRADPEFTPHMLPSSKEKTWSELERLSQTQINISSNFVGVLTLINQQKAAERAVLRRSTSVGGRGPGRPPNIVASQDFSLEELLPSEDEVQKQNELQRRGASFALKAIASFFGETLPTKQPQLWEVMLNHLQAQDEKMEASSSSEDSTQGGEVAAEELVGGLQVLEVVCPSLHANLEPQVMACLPQLCQLLEHPYRAVRHLTSRVLAELGRRNSVPVMGAVVERTLALLGADNLRQRQGAVEAIACIVEALQIHVVPYVVLLVVPLLGRMSDQDLSVRTMATFSFATLIQLMPLDGSVPEPLGITEDLIAKRSAERRFLEQLFNPRTIDNYVVPVPIKAELRSYQQAGINWLAFLNRYSLHGILCDDMGLGKTLQSICMLAGDHFHRLQEYKRTRSPDCAPLPSLVVCPPTLTGHWVDEVEKFLKREHLNPLQYVGPPAERERLRSKVKHHNLIIASYDIVRKDIDFFSKIKWNYCILDEGHIIKNGKTKSSVAIKKLIAKHRLILSGTPIQNNVLELWSLFDFLMPSFLGTERQFTERYSKPILASRDPKSSPKEQEAGALSMEALHRQVLPFLLRRMKEDVLQDLPPKITQDYYCTLSPLQQQLYEDFERTQAHQSLRQSLAKEPTKEGGPAMPGGRYHIFQALHYLQNVCNHPRLVLSPQHPEYERITQQLRQQNSSLSDIHHSAKLPALKQLLLDCGIGVPTGTEQAGAASLVVNQHRALIFCQLKAMLDIVEKDLLRAHMPDVSYLRLDGSIPAGQRHTVVSHFNSDPSIDVLLLTTQVGGLGLNLTGADTVIFVEHDWNPMKDLQAMDRAHRIGQKKVVNVYRLVTRATLEEKIMGLQKFKLLTANTVISSENASLDTMGSVELLDLFLLDKKGADGSKGPKSEALSTGSLSMCSVLESLPALWDDKQYEKEYDLASFMQSLRS